MEFDFSKKSPKEIAEEFVDIDIEIEPKFNEGKYIDVIIDHRIMKLFEDGVKVNSFPVSSGIP